MGTCAGKEGPWHAPLLPEARTIKWVISDWEWRAYVDRTYTQEIVRGVADIDDVQLRAELAMPLLTSGATVQQDPHPAGVGKEQHGPGQSEDTSVSVGRAVRVADGFITYGDVLLHRTQWEACEGSKWVLVGVSNADARTCSQHSGELVQIEKGIDEVMLCIGTGKPAVKPQFHRSFGGKSFQLQEKNLGVGSKNKHYSMPSMPSMPLVDEDKTKCGDKDQPPRRLLWRCSTDGKAEVNVVGVGAVGDQEEWWPCELHFHNNSSRLTVAAHGPDGKTPQRLVLVLERLLSLDDYTLRFHGVDLVFDPGMDTYWALWNSHNVQEVVLHLARVDEQRLLLQLVYSIAGYNGDMRPAALTVPVPLDELQHLEPIVSRWQQFVRPLIFEDRVYSTDEEFANAMASWLMLDMALGSANCAALLAGTGFAISAMDTKDGAGHVADDHHGADQDFDAEWFPTDFSIDAVF